LVLVPQFFFYPEPWVASRKKGHERKKKHEVKKRSTKEKRKKEARSKKKKKESRSKKRKKKPRSEKKKKEARRKKETTKVKKMRLFGGVNKIHLAIGVSYFVMIAAYALVVWRSGRPIEPVSLARASSSTPTARRGMDDVVVSLFGQTKDEILANGAAAAGSFALNKAKSLAPNFAIGAVASTA
jgi:hypothetical protein